MIDRYLLILAFGVFSSGVLIQLGLTPDDVTHVAFLLTLAAGLIQLVNAGAEEADGGPE